MARDDSKQILMGGRCGMVDAGSIAFSTTDTIVIVNTPLTFAASAIGITVTGKLVCSAPAGVITNGAITFTRADGSVSADVLHYIITGY